MRSLKEHDLDLMIGELYETVLHSAHWADWFASAARKFECDSGLLLTQNTRNGDVDMLGIHNLSPKAMQLYADYYHQCDLWTQRSSRTLMRATRSEDLCTDQEFANSEIYTDFSVPHGGGAFYVVGAVLPVGDNVAVTGFQNIRPRGAFSQAHAIALDRLLPHLQRALIIQDRLKKADQREADAQAALDALEQGVMTVSLAGTVLYANVAAQEILRKGDGIGIAGGGALIASRSRDSNVLRSLIAGCASAAGGGAMNIPRPSNLRSLEVVVMPLSTTNHLNVTRNAAALVFLRDPESKAAPLPRVLKSLYGLTPAEGQLAAELLKHLTLEQIAERRGVGRETLRTQLKELFRKTGTSRQSELVGFLASGLATTLRSRRQDVP